MRRFQSRIVDASNFLVSAGNVTVYKTGTQTLASLFSGEGLVVLANPFKSDHLGVFEFYVEGGDYDIAVQDPDTGFARRFYDVSIFDARDLTVLKSGDSMQGQLRLQSGSISEPGLGFVGDPDTGFYRPQADEVGVAVGGAEAARYKATRHTFKQIATRVKALNSQSIADDSQAAVAWDAEDFDTGGFHNPAVNPSRITADRTGFYDINASINFAGATGGSRRIRVYKNAVTILIETRYDPNPGTFQFGLSGLAQLSSGDYIESYVWQNSGAPLWINIDANALASAFFSLHYVGE